MQLLTLPLTRSYNIEIKKQIVEKLIKICVCNYNLAKREAQIIKAKFCICNSNFIQIEL